MKLNQFFVYVVALFFVLSCAKPVGQSLLSSEKVEDTEDTDPVADDSSLSISPDNAEMSMNIDDSDKIEVTGSCVDLDRRKNRILVEVFAGEDETGLPYISNAISDKCQDDSGVGSPLSGLPVTDKCFWVSKGIGAVEDSGLPTQRSFPQCHNGRFGFSVKLGKLLLNGSNNPNYKYTIRFKLRTLEGLISDSPWSRATVERNLTPPFIESVTQDPKGFSCTLNMAPARFNTNITYDLLRTSNDGISTLGPFGLFVQYRTSWTASGDSSFRWTDNNVGGTPAHSLPVLPGQGMAQPGIISGMTYSYTLRATETQYVYAALPNNSQITTTTPVTCDTPNPQITFTQDPTVGTCYLAFLGVASSGGALGTGTRNPILSASGNPATVQWGYSTDQAWTGGPEGTNTDAFTDGSANAVPGCIAPANAVWPNCTAAGLASGTTYYFAAREIGFGQVGRWSNLVKCKPP